MRLLRCVVLGLVAAASPACSQSIPRLSFAVEQRLLRETTLDDLPDGRSEPGDGVVRIVRTGKHPGRCSGALVGPRHVMTAAHCVAERDGRREMTLGQITPGDLHVELGGGYLPWGRVGVRLVRACDGYAGDVAHDLAMLVLSSPVPSEVAPFALGYHVPEEAAVYELGGFGTSAQPRLMPATGWSVSMLERHVFRGPVTRVTDTMLMVELPGRPGDSGGPIVDTTTGRLVSVVSHGRAADEWSRSGEASPLVTGPRLSTCRQAIADALAR
ncbi:MAG: trypsin-like serine protease [Labilithrix sp.]|nr:trypsin-like serine protease [Labilithrix sp.]